MKKLLSVATVICLGSLSCDMVLGMNTGSYNQRIAQYTQHAFDRAKQVHDQGNDGEVKNIVAIECQNPDVLRNLLWLAVHNNYSWLAEEMFSQYGSQIKVDDWRNYDGQTPFMQATINDNVGMAELFAMYGTSVFDENDRIIFDKHGNGAIYYAIEKGGRVLDWMHLNEFDFNQFCTNRYEIPLIVAYKKNKEVFNKMLSWEDVDRTAFLRNVLWEDLIEQGDFNLFCDKINYLGNNSALNEIKENGISLLTKAIRYDKLRFVEYLTKYVVDATTVKIGGDGILHFAARYSDDILQYLLAIGAGRNINAPDSLGRSAIWEAISSEKVENVRILCQQTNVDLSKKDYRGRTALDFAIECEICASMDDERLEIVCCLIKEMIDRGIGVKDADIDNWLCRRSENGRGDSNAVKKLIKYCGTSILEVSNRLLGDAIVDCKSDDSTVLNYIVERYKTADEKNKSTILNCIVRNSEALRYLFDNHVVGEDDVNIGDSDGWTPLMYAVVYEEVKSVEILCQQSNIDFSKRDKLFKKTALGIAKKEGYPEIAQIIIDAMAKQAQEKAEASE